MPFDTVTADQRQQCGFDSSPELRSLRLCGARVALGPDSAVAADVEIVGGRIRDVVRCGTSASSRDREAFDIDLTGYLLLPGLINAHDHLEFSLFPKLGRGLYANAADWAKDIYHPDSSPVREHLLVPKPVRLWWGGIKNLLCGVTTVCHHNEFHEDIFENEFPVRVLKRYAWAHSLRFSRDIAAAFEASDSQTPYIIHLGEGTDAASAAEIFELDRRGLLEARTSIVHGVALDDAGHDLVIRRGASLIWCPGSNLFTLGTTLSPERIDRNPRTALGSDSALTAGDLLEQIAIAHELGVSAKRIFELVTTRAADVLKLQDGEGNLRTGSRADIIAIPDAGLSPAEALVRTLVRTKTKPKTDAIELVLSMGRPHLLSRPMLPRFPVELHSGLNEISVEGLEQYVRAPVSRLLREAHVPLGDTVRLAGKQVRA
jgi:cytosine/adenosine deaminase-related metal-dependent hydrolase